MLNDQQIFEANMIAPFNMEQLQPHSYDCTLGTSIQTPYDVRDKVDILEMFGTLPEEAKGLPKIGWEEKELPPQGGLIQPGKFLLGTTVEYFKLPQNVVGFVQGKSTVGRNGLQIECAGLIDAGFEGTITLELYNMAPWPIVLKPGMKICQIHFTYVDAPTMKDYTKIGHYNGQKGATKPAYNLFPEK